MKKFILTLNILFILGTLPSLAQNSHENAECYSILQFAQNKVEYPKKEIVYWGPYFKNNQRAVGFLDESDDKFFILSFPGYGRLSISGTEIEASGDLNDVLGLVYVENTDKPRFAKIGFSKMSIF